MAAQGDSWDMVVGDSQWLGQGVTEGHYMDLTDFLVGEGIADTVTEATLTYYGEYPTGSGKYWAYPTEGDAEGWAYRRDLFEDPANMEAFEAEYGYPLAPPETYDQLMDIAQFFTRPDEGIYGVALHTRVHADVITMGVENTMFSWGADWQDENNDVLGGQGMSIVNYISDERKEAAKDFIRWFAQDDVQTEWALLGGFSNNVHVLQTQEFLDATPLNPAFAESMTFVKDFWNVPVYGELLEVAERELNNFINEGEGTAAETMNAIAEEHHQILLDAGLITE